MRVKKQIVEKIVNILVNGSFFLIVIFGIYISFKMNGNNRSLWHDEAALSYSFSKRSFFELTKTALEKAQSAPVLWLYIVKSITMIWGNTEYTLRIVSVFSYVFSLFFIFILSKKLCNIKYPIGVSAFVAMIPFFIKYSNVFKPYEFDSICVLLVIFTYYEYKKKKINHILLSIIWAILIWGSNPTCFFQGGFLLLEFLEFIKDKKKKDVFWIGTSVVCSFIIYYLYWLRQSVSSMQDYWDEYRFPLFIYNASSFKRLVSCFYIIFNQFEKLKTVFLFLFIIGILFAIIKKNKMIIGVYCGFYLTFFASAIGFFPVSDRLWVFSYPLISMLIFYTLDVSVTMIFELIFKRKSPLVDICLLIIMFFFIGTNQGWRYLYTFNLWWPHQELNTEIEYIKNNIVEGEHVYITSHAMCGYQYKMGYDNHSINGMDDVVYYNLGYEKGIELIESLDNCYIVVTHYVEGDPNDDITKLLDGLSKDGYLQLISYEYYTPLYYFSTNDDMLKEEVDPQKYSIFD